MRVIKHIRKHWISILSCVFSISAFALVSLRIEPIDFNNGSLITIVTALIAVCATFMVASQVMSLHTSKQEINKMITSEVRKVRKDSYFSTIMTLFRVEVFAAIRCVESQEWSQFIKEIKYLTDYALEINSSERADDVVKLIVDAQDKFSFVSHLSSEDMEVFNYSICSLLKLSSRQAEIIDKFFNHYHDKYQC